MARTVDNKLYIKQSEVQAYCKKYDVWTKEDLDNKLWYEYGIMLIVEDQVIEQDEKYRREMMDENYSRDVAGCCRIIIGFCIVAIIVGAVLLLT